MEKRLEKIKTQKTTSSLENQNKNKDSDNSSSDAIINDVK